MESEKNCLIKMSKYFMAAAVCLTLPLSAYADNSATLSLETAKLDTAQPTVPETSTLPGKTEMLYGGVKKHEQLTEGANTLDGSAAENDANLKTEKAASDAAKLYRLATQKLAAGEQLTSEEYRSLGAGCAGYESDRTFFQSIAKVSIVYRDSPADKAGLRKGDRLLDIDTEEDNKAKSNPSQPRWSIVCGLAGTPCQLTILRHGKQIKLTLIRMNIEDIEEPDKRQEWEDTIRKLGYPQGGTFAGTSMNDLQPVSTTASNSN